MALSRAEIEQIALSTARHVVTSLHRYAVTYKEPETIEEGLTESMGEELTAANWYRQRAKHARSRGDQVTATLYEEIAGEEDHHYNEFTAHLAKRGET